MPGLVLEPTEREFLSLRGAATVVPVSCELPVGAETPLSAFAKLRDLPASFLLESVEGPAHVARFSVVGGNPRLILEGEGRGVRVIEPSGTVAAHGDALGTVREYLGRYRAEPPPGLPPFTGGFVGYLGYDAVRLWERLPGRPPDDLGCPVFRLGLMDAVVVFDHRRHALRVVANAFLDEGAEVAYRRARERIDALRARLARPAPALAPAPGLTVTPRANLTPEAYCAAVEQAQEYIRAGEIYQIILAQRFAAPVGDLDPLAAYRALRTLNPSPYMFCLDAGAGWLVGASPERLVRLEQGRVDMRPLAGTRPRGATPEADAALAAELAADPKEQAEHVMLVDLTRNDLGRISRYGSVRVRELMTIERYSHVMHLTSHVEGEVEPGRGAWDVLQAVFPHGTVTGAPKVRAMELIDTLEPVARGPYAGCVGYVGFDGALNTGITIRTVFLHRGTAYVQAGAGVVADSIPEREHQECVAKARGVLRALEHAGGADAAGHR
jgi:anthranilate synthase component 1